MLFYFFIFYVFIFYFFVKKMELIVEKVLFCSVLVITASFRCMLVLTMCGVYFREEGG